MGQEGRLFNANIPSKSIAAAKPIEYFVDRPSGNRSRRPFEKSVTAAFITITVVNFAVRISRIRAYHIFFRTIFPFLVAIFNNFTILR